MKNIINIGKNSKKAFEGLKKIKHETINKTLNDYVKLISINKVYTDSNNYDFYSIEMGYC